MKRRILMIAALFLPLVAGAESWDFDKHIRITPTNATEHGVTVAYHAPVPALVTVEVPYVVEKASFDEALLELQVSGQHMKLPLHGKKDGEKLVLAFWMDRMPLREATLRIHFARPDSIEGLMLRLEFREFIAEDRKEAHNQVPEDTARKLADPQH